MAKLKKNYNNLNEYLSGHKRKEGDEFTHTAIGNKAEGIYPGSYTIPLNEMDIFNKFYHTHVFKKGNDAYLTERHRDISPIVIDLDFRFKSNVTRKYTLDHIKRFLDIYREIISNLLEGVSENNLTAFVLEKPFARYITEKEITKDGLHIIFPFIITSPNLQYVARFKTITNPDAVKLFNNIGITNDISDIFDKSVISSNNWQMYGSRKPGNEAYELKVILDYNNKEIDLDTYSSRDLLGLLTVRNFNPEYKYNYSEEEVGKIEEILENMPQKYKVNSKSMNKTGTHHNNIKLKSPKNKKYTGDEELGIARKLAGALGVERAESFDSWIRVGWCLHNIDHRLIDEWREFSKQSDKFVEGECEREWNYMNSEGLGMGSLCRWAKEDDAIEYRNIMKDNLQKTLLESLSGTHNDIARVVYNMYKHDFVCVSISKKHWFHFKNHRWRRIDEAVTLRKLLSTKIIDKYLMLSSELSKKAADIQNTSKELLVESTTKITNIMLSLKKTPFKRSVVEECAELFYSDDFEEKLDANVNLIGFENGVYDLVNSEFREGYPEDYVSFSTSIYYTEFNKYDSEIQQVNLFLRQVLPIETVRQYMIRLISSFLSGKTGAEKFYIWTGVGGNGKSKILELFRNCFRDYCATLPVAIITQKRARAESASPALASTRGKRFVMLQEAEGDEQINVSLMKELTGGDIIKARKLHQDFFEFKPQFKPVLTCNILPEVNANDRGTWRRMRVVDFISIFKHNPDPNNPHEFMIDENLEEKLMVWKEAFMYILLEEYKKYKKEGIVEPTEVLNATRTYQYDNDNFSEFFDEYIVEVNKNKSDGITLTEIYTMYKDWYKKIKGKESGSPKRKDLKNNLIKKYGAPKFTTWFNITFKNTHFIEEEKSGGSNIEFEVENEIH